MSFTCCTGNWMATPSFLIANLKIKINPWCFLEPNILPACCNARDWQGDDDNSVAVHYNWILKVFSMSSEHRRGLTFWFKKLYWLRKFILLLEILDSVAQRSAARVSNIYENRIYFSTEAAIYYLLIQFTVQTHKQLVWQSWPAVVCKWDGRRSKKWGQE